MRRIKNTGDIDYYKWAEQNKNPFAQPTFSSDLKEALEEILKKTPFVRYKKVQNTLQRDSSPDLLECGPDSSAQCFESKNYLDRILTVFLKSQSLYRGNAYFIRTKRKLQHPFQKCINNPSHFFGLEKKVIVGKIGEDGMAYGEEGGQITRLNVTESFLMNTQRDQGSNQGSNTNFGLGGLTLLSSATLMSILGTANKAKWIRNHPYIAITTVGLLAFSGFTASLGYDWRVYEGTGKRRWFSIAVVEGVELISERTPISIPLEKYHECLVIRPRFNAFELDSNKYEPIWNIENPAIRAIYEKTGLLLCTEGKATDRTIQEDYYYIYPDHPINAISSDSRSHRNRPFAISLRGKTAYHRFKDSISCEVAETTEPIKTDVECRDTRGQYENLFSKYIEFADNLEEGFETPKLFHLTGDFPGVYSPYVAKPDRNIKADQKWYHRVINLLARHIPNLDLEKIIYKEPEQ